MGILFTGVHKDVPEDVLTHFPIDTFLGILRRDGVVEDALEPPPIVERSCEVSDVWSKGVRTMGVLFTGVHKDVLECTPFAFLWLEEDIVGSSWGSSRGSSSFLFFPIILCCIDDEDARKFLELEDIVCAKKHNREY